MVVARTVTFQRTGVRFPPAPRVLLFRATTRLLLGLFTHVGVNLWRKRLLRRRGFKETSEKRSEASTPPRRGSLREAEEDARPRHRQDGVLPILAGLSGRCGRELAAWYGAQKDHRQRSDAGGSQSETRSELARLPQPGHQEVRKAARGASHHGRTPVWRRRRLGLPGLNK